MIETHLFTSDRRWRKLCRHRPTVLAAFSFRYDVDLVPDLVTHLETMVDGYVAFDDRDAQELFSNEPSRRRALIEKAREVGASWVLAIDPDERFERALSTRIRLLTESPRRIVWQFQLREMFSLDAYRIDGIWGLKEQGRLFPIFDGAYCSTKALHGAWCSPPDNYVAVPTGLNLYHLKMISQKRRAARRALYNHLDPEIQHQHGGYDYLTDERGAKFETIPEGRDFFPAHDERVLVNEPTPDVVSDPTRKCRTATPFESLAKPPMRNGIVASQLGQFTVEIGVDASSSCDLAVVVIGLGAPAALLSAVLSLLQQNPVPEIVVVNSGGGRAVEVLEAVRSRITIVEVDEPIFVGAARNIGIRIARAPYIGFLASDCIAEPEWVAHRLRIHTNGAVAVSSAVVCGAPDNSYAQAAYLLTYARRMPGLPAEQLARYGASYDRDLFDKYGFFSEYRRVGEDSEFHRRLRLSDDIQHSDLIRTAHADPTRFARLVSDQFARGMRARYLYEFLVGEYALADAFRGAYRRCALALVSSVRSPHSANTFSSIRLWVNICVGALAFLTGSLLSYATVLRSRFFSRRAAEAFSQSAGEKGALFQRRAMELRPGFPPLERRAGQTCASAGEIHLAATHLYRAAEMEHASIWSNLVLSLSPPGGRTRPRPLALTIVVLSYAQPTRLNELLNAIRPQLHEHRRSRLVVVRADPAWRHRKLEQRVRATHGRFVDFLSATEFRRRGAQSSLGFPDHVADYVVITTDDFVPPSDWFQTFDDYARSMPEVDFFTGTIRPSLPTKRWSLAERSVEDMIRRFKLIPQHNGPQRLFEFGPAMSVGCRASLYDSTGGLVENDATLRGAFGLRKAVMQSGGVVHEAAGWVTAFRCDTGFLRLLALSWADGFQSTLYGSTDTAPTRSKLRSTMFASIVALVERATLFAGKRSAHAPTAPVSLAKRYLWQCLLLGLGLAREAGRAFGRKHRLAAKRPV